MQAVFSVRSVPRLYNEDHLPLPVSRERLCRQAVSKLLRVAESGDSSEAQSKGETPPLPSSGVKTDNSSLCVI
jgi:hypothetical protein